MKTHASGMPAPSSDKAVVMFIGQLATYLCDAGDIQPTYALQKPIAEDMLNYFCSTTLAGVKPVASASAAAVSTTQEPSSVAASFSASSSSIRSMGQSSTAAASPLVELASKLHPIITDRDVMVVIALSTTPIFQAQLMRFLFCQHVKVRSAVVLSDVVACSLACGAASESVVLHASPSQLCLAHVMNGTSVRHSTTRLGSVQSLLQSAARRAAASSSTAGVKKEDSSQPPSLGASLRASWSSSSSFFNSEQLTTVNLSNEAYREELISAFGYRVYCRVMNNYHLSLVKKAGGGKGKGKGAGRLAAGDDAWKKSYSRKQREMPGSLEKILARVTNSGGLPAVVAGEGLQAPLMAELLQEMVRRCSPAIMEAVEKEARQRKRTMKQRDRAVAAAAAAAASALAAVKKEEEEGTGTKKNEVKKGEVEKKKRAARKRARSSSDDEDASSLSESEASATASSSESDEESDDDDNTSSDEESSDSESESSATSGSSCAESESSSAGGGEWLYAQELPLPDVPWWLPLLGGSMMSQLPATDLAKMRITHGEVVSSEGTIVHWKAVL